MAPSGGCGTSAIPLLSRDKQTSREQPKSDASDPMQTSWVGVPFNYEARLHRGKAQIVDVTSRWKLNGESLCRAPSLNVR